MIYIYSYIPTHMNMLRYQQDMKPPKPSLRPSWGQVCKGVRCPMWSREADAQADAHRVSVQNGPTDWCTRDWLGTSDLGMIWRFP